MVYGVVIGVDYFAQFAVVIPSLQAGENKGLSLFTQYNPHGLFIAGEVYGYVAMSLALLFAAAVFAGGRIERAIRRVFVAGFVLAVLAFIAFWIVGGDLIAFEVSLLSINWIVLIASRRAPEPRVPARWAGRAKLTLGAIGDRPDKGPILACWPRTPDPSPAKWLQRGGGASATGRWHLTSRPMRNASVSRAGPLDRSLGQRAPTPITRPTA